MAEVVFIYEQDRPVAFQFDVSGDVSVQFLLPLDDAFGSREIILASRTHVFDPPLASQIRILYAVSGAANTAFRVTTTFFQGYRKEVHVSEGIVGYNGRTDVSLDLRAVVIDHNDDWFRRHMTDRDAFDKGVEHYNILRPDEVMEVITRPRKPTSGTASDDYDVWFGTDRQPLPSLTGFSGKRDTVTHFGRCRVEIPRSHKIGSLGSPWWKRVLHGDDRLKVGAVEELDESVYWSSVANGLNGIAIDERDAVVFLHGFNVSFEEAALRAAQLGVDLGITSLMAFYSWPSRGELKGYTADEASIEASEGFITDYLTSMATKSGASRIHIIAHSMGNRALLRVMDRIAANAAERAQKPFSQIILAAPDVDQDTFKRLSVAYQQVAERTTLYVCSKDKAVEASHWLHGFPRAGLTPPVLVVPGIDTINVSNLDLTGLAHGYVAEARDVLQDMYRLLRDGAPPEQRFGLRREATSDGQQYWAVGS